MQVLKDRIRKDGKVKEGNVLKVDSFLNHQMDTALFREMGKEFKRRFAGEEINKILTIEASGIGYRVRSSRGVPCTCCVCEKDADEKYRRRCV